MSKKQEIIFLYYEKYLSPTEIAKSVNVSKTYITEVIKSDKRYVLEKEKRKSKNKTKNIEETKKYIKLRREQERSINESIKAQHLQATIELSCRHYISNINIRKWNASAYTFNKIKRCYEFDSNLTKSYAIPKYIK